MPALSKTEATARMYELAGRPVEPLGPGSKEKRSAFEALGAALDLDLSEVRTKVSCCSEIALRLDVVWDQNCYSSGDSITLVGMNRLLDGFDRTYPGRGPERLVNVPPAPADDLNVAYTEESEMSQDVTYQGVVEDPRAAIEQALAEQLALLSEYIDTPTGVLPPSGDFDAGSVDFSSYDWIEKLVEVQGWFRFEAKLAGEPNDALLALAANLGYPVPGDALEDANDGYSRLSDDALDRFKGWAEQAVDYADKFEAELEREGGTRTAATAAWADLWEEGVEEVVHPEPIAAKTDIWSINEFVARAKNGKLNLIPSYQRSDVWPVKDRQLLIISILRGIPLPAIILTKPQMVGDPWEVVDGKQRLTSILRFTGQHPVALARVAEFQETYKDVGEDFESLFQTNYPKFRLAWKSLVGEDLSATQEAEFYFPFRLPTDGKLLPLTLQNLKGKYYCQIRDEIIQIGDEETDLGSVFELTSVYKVPVIEYLRVSPRQVHEVFHLYNKQGKQLNPEEIRNAIYHEVDLTRALLATAGDALGEPAWSGVADFLEPVWEALEDVGHTLQGYSFGTARYKRTKVLSWIVALIAFDTFEGDKVRGMSTTRLIDSLLERIKAGETDRLRDQEVIRKLLSLVAGAIAAHAAVDAWADNFKDGSKGNKWLELGLVGSVAGVALAASVHDDFKQRLKDKQQELLTLSASDSWKRPGNAQSANQYEYIARVARETATILGTNEFQVDAALGELLGESGVKAIWNVQLPKASK